MTDIRRHLPALLSCLRRFVASADSTPEAVREELTALLPASYGVAIGCVVNKQGWHSFKLDLVIYDRTIASNLSHKPDEIDARQALVVAMLRDEVDSRKLDAALRGIASVKALWPAQRTQQSQMRKNSGSIPKTLFPLGVVALRRLVGVQSQEMAAIALDAALKGYDVQQRPEFVIAQEHGLSYRSPWLDGATFEAATMNVAQGPELVKARSCHICKDNFTRQHFFYARFCLHCRDLNYQNRQISADLSGRVALVTGARIKIGYATTLRLLRSGARVIATTRFPHDAARRYSNEPDFAVWRERLDIYGLDFRQLGTLEQFCNYLQTAYPALDILINNAAQTVWRPAAYYAHLMELERAPLATLPQSMQALVARSEATLPRTQFVLAESSTVASSNPLTLITRDDAEHSGHLFPSGYYNEHEEQLDLRPQNSWTQRLEEVNMTEFLEVQVVNVTAPFMLINRLLPLLRRSSFDQRFIINVSAAEGWFTQEKLGVHPHTNMAKAALNMLTHTSATDLAQYNIFMNSVDPGWVSHQVPRPNHEQEQLEPQRQPPLDLVDAAARVCDPIFTGIITGQHASGQLYRHYQPTVW